MIQKIISKKTLFLTFSVLMLFHSFFVSNGSASSVVKEEVDQSNQTSGSRKRAASMGSIEVSRVSDKDYLEGKLVASMPGVHKENKEVDEQVNSMRRVLSYGLNGCLGVAAFFQLIRFDQTLSKEVDVFLGAVGLSCVVGALGINLVLNHL